MVRLDERTLTERLISYDTSEPEGIRRAQGFIKSWLEAREIDVRESDVRGLPVLAAEVGSGEPAIVFHGHVDVVPGRPMQFESRLEGDRLYGRGSYDMKGALAAMMLAVEELAPACPLTLRFAVVPDEESEEPSDRGSDRLVEDGFIGDFAITGEPTNLHVGVEAKGVLAMRLEIEGLAAHGSTPWLGDNAVLKAIDVFRRIESLPFSRESSELFDRPSINLGRMWGGDRFNKVPDICLIDVDVRYLPGQDPAEIVSQVEGIGDTKIVSMFSRAPAIVDRDGPFVTALCAAVAQHHAHDSISVGRDGASDAISFIEAGVPAVEFGPVGEGHHGPAEWVSLSSLNAYREALTGFVRSVAGEAGGKGGLRVVG